MNPTELKTKINYYQRNKERVKNQQQICRLKKRQNETIETHNNTKPPSYNRRDSVFVISIIKQHKFWIMPNEMCCEHYLDFSNSSETLIPMIQFTPKINNDIKLLLEIPIILNIDIPQSPILCEFADEFIPIPILQLKIPIVECDFQTQPYTPTTSYKFDECSTPSTSGSIDIDMNFIKNMHLTDDILHNTLENIKTEDKRAKLLASKQRWRDANKEHTKKYHHHRRLVLKLVEQYQKFHLIIKQVICILCPNQPTIIKVIPKSSVFMPSTNSTLQKQRVSNTIYRANNRELITFKRKATRIKNIMITFYKTYHNVCNDCNN